MTEQTHSGESTAKRRMALTMKRDQFYDELTKHDALQIFLNRTPSAQIDAKEYLIFCGFSFDEFRSLLRTDPWVLLAACELLREEEGNSLRQSVRENSPQLNLL